MRYDEKTDQITLSAGELISLSLLRLPSEAAALPPVREMGGTGGHRLSATFAEGGHTFCLYAYAEIPPAPETEPVCRENGETDEMIAPLSLSFAVEGDPAAPDRATLRRVRGEMFALAWIALQGCTAAALSVCAALTSPDGKSALREENITRDAAEKFMARLRPALTTVAREEVERVAVRLPTLRELPFPYAAPRESQREMMQATYRTLRRGGRLFVAAPTGTGKTAAALYPALRALGAGEVEKVFYLTPKTTTAQAAGDALARFARAGGRIRAISLLAKERLCPEGLLCRDGAEVCRRRGAGEGREEEAVRHLLSLDRVPITYRDVLDCARTFGVCPYELSLRYSLFCDVIIADYNYLFDPRVRLARYFTAGGDYAFLIDEAHDLLDRATKIYGGALSGAELSALCEALSAGGAATLPLLDGARAAEALYATVCKNALRDAHPHEDRDGISHRFAAEKAAPTRLLTALGALAEATLKLAADRRLPTALRRRLRDAAYPVRDFSLRGGWYDECFETFYFEDATAARIEIVCLDPAKCIDRCLSLGKSALLFSATLTPLSYYKTVLGGTGEELELPSPFDGEHLSVAVVDRISTRFTTREENAAAVAAAIAAMTDARRGNYLVFSPSFAYMETLSRAFAAIRPTAELLVQARHSTPAEREIFLARFGEEPQKTLVGFAVTGSVFAEGIDLAGTRLIGVAVVGVSLPQPSPEREAVSAYYDDRFEAGREYAYIYPGMNRVLQAAGRVIRSEEDRGILLLIDDRFGDPLYRRMIPPHWRHLKFVGDAAAAHALFTRFWRAQK